MAGWLAGWLGGQVAGESGIKANLSLSLSWSWVELSWGWAWQKYSDLNIINLYSILYSDMYLLIIKHRIKANSQRASSYALFIPILSKFLWDTACLAGRVKGCGRLWFGVSICAGAPSSFTSLNHDTNFLNWNTAKDFFVLKIITVSPWFFRTLATKYSLQYSNKCELEVTVCHCINHRVQGRVEVSWKIW